MATRWGFAGAGQITHDFITALATLPKSEHRLFAVAAQDLSRAEKFAKLHEVEKAYGSYKELSQDKDIDVVYVGTIQTTHFDVVKLVLNAGKNVLCEKPMALNLKQTTELIALAKSKGLFLMEAVWSRCFPIYEEIKKEIDSGCIGEVKQIICSFGFRMPHIQRLCKKEMGGGTILDLGVYTLQLPTFIFNGEKPESVKALGYLNEDGVDLSMSATLKFKGDRMATILTSGLVNLPNEAFIVGTEGTIKIPNFWCPTRAELPNRVIEITLPTGKHEFNFPNSGGLSFEAAEVRSCLLKGLKESPKISHADSLLLAELEDELRKQIGVVYDAD
ncbi:trans-1,2-dihydrobenzene-1,2-diol dehydrogenase-like [Belonocnema kinseyi]|uniref:trans-1,2-dihydrobenzene-1,2-diol dehydrogenase-like n=1 Tax=Belonocnema kinseyi TaxID=2817044 RepID=UPI00143CFBE0|nr:trans-1,2-dihydrobenzene-1,2-diol dehydrogenase-like [Belonocnema kinseyi]XP_033222247.1 trans-1,2-dihydrobenzene-1,2-diol dehydrogenase-like [Belonocnema kinseyi]XP_033222248.1 trans-1,2-dihydrobenzene-1,2-diol dehydrogenase-like [Belonocnema kinseyi]XP_033222249.1 trans-1,2-dihydrobenzene-1,2-diol dehydrogenase-like [Belonocnema kinseyi]